MKTALITGAAQGLGLATATLLAQQNYRVVLTDLQPLDSQVAALRAGGADALGSSGDIASEDFVKQLAARVARDYGALDALVNNAGISLIAPAGRWSRLSRRPRSITCSAP